MQPISIKELFKLTWHTYTGHLAHFARPVFILLISMLIFGVATMSDNRSIILEFALLLVVVFISLWMEVVMIRITDAIMGGRVIDSVTLYPTSMRLIAPYFITEIVVGVAVVAGLIALIVPGVIVAVWLAFASAIVALSGMRPMRAISASRELVRGYWMHTFISLVVPAATYALLCVLFSVGIMTLITRSTIDIATLGTDPVLSGVMQFVFTVASPLFIGITVAVLHNLRDLQREHTNAV